MEHNEQIKFSWLPLFIVSIILINLAFLVIFWINKEISAEKFSRHPNTSIDHEQPMVQSKQKEPRLHNVGNMPKPSDRNNQENPNNRIKSIAKVEKSGHPSPANPTVVAEHTKPKIPRDLPTSTHQDPVSVPDSAKNSIEKMVKIRQAQMEMRKQLGKVQSTLSAPDIKELQQQQSKFQDQQKKLPIETIAPVASSQENTTSDNKQAASKPVTHASPAKPELPFLRNLPFEFRRNVPKLNINVFVYAENPVDRFIMIDMVKYTSDHQISPGMELKEIRDNSLVVTYKNKTFQIKRP